ncbi:MAG: hypothetical protein KatS3mg118_0579 [Paracoccaceae bacterium]|nr:MAG: hypothetical protein KatS3mg118_0579 [Paracoccaceae bacterium]
MRMREQWLDLEWLAVAGWRHGMGGAGPRRAPLRVRWAGGDLAVGLDGAGLGGGAMAILNRLAISTGVFARRATAPALPAVAPPPVPPAAPGAGGPADDLVIVAADAAHRAMRMILAALPPAGGRVHLVAPGEIARLEALLARLDPARTRALIHAAEWSAPTLAVLALLAGRLPPSPGRAGPALLISTRAPEAALALGLGRDAILPLADGPAGAAIGACLDPALALAIGADARAELVRGAAEADAHFRTAPPEGNIPLLLGFADLCAGIRRRGADGAGAPAAAWPEGWADLGAALRAGRGAVAAMARDVLAEAAPGRSDALARALDVAPTGAGAEPALVIAHGGRGPRMLGRLLALAERRAEVAAELWAACPLRAAAGTRRPASGAG